MTDGPKIQAINNAPNEPVYYANIASLNVTPEELIIHFGLRTPEDSNIGIGVAKVYVSLPHAKRLASAMIRVIQVYERNFGEIISEPEMRLTPEGKKSLGIE